MSTTSRTARSGGGTTALRPGPALSGGSGGFPRSLSPSGRSNSAFASSTASSFAARSSPFFHHHHHRAASPTRVHLVGSGSPSLSSSAVRFSVSPSSRDHHHHHHHQIVRKHHQQYHPSPRQPSQPRRTCMCSPTTHPGSFRCALHKNVHASSSSSSSAVSSPSHRLNARRSAMTNSLVRIGTVEGDLVKRALAALIRPSSHQQRRRGTFQPRPSRLSIMSKAADDDSQ